ncbi:DUF4835 family protein [candidate division KSB1 bacterium]|nr:DUF4835 family protein [candidate division KSB1 bacterium]
MNSLRPHFLAMLVLLLGIVGSGSSAFAQLIDPKVTIDMTKLPEEAHAKLTGLDSLISAYLRAQEWAGDEYNYDFAIDINIYLTDYNPDPQEDKYKAKLIATNRSDVRFEDNRWEFGLRAPVALRANQYDAFKSTIEFYVWMLMGTEYDKLEKLGGRPYYDKARQIYLQSSGTIYYFGWDKRYDLLTQYVSDDNETARELAFFYDTGIFYDAEGDTASAKSYLYYALVKLQKVTIAAQEKFLEQNHRALAEALARSGYAKGVRSLAAMDPAHREVYDAIVPEEGAK